ncbi:HIT family protein [Malaciobacter mytili]|uniref:Diadenosine tetraphosphate hydrolase n=1 Tax=Malaciobacter mytili LMG 24559 TaxID=1032238 RepID=A0AAX2AH10_9BACT|nr:HIT domain-containing protein [Malaciobacter mytili]AXH15683.1 diadenosine tetraphosphate (Ap4A) hydrolase, HIT family [Malaciobacter mytili LMG 24559]RXK16133.1 diadenosine tetraphosphate hydrolase [Malaciobacter mytili LMG 24559]
MKNNCIFCDIVANKSTCHKVWEDEKHLAFLSIFPNCEGVTVVIPKKHYSSYAFELEEDVFLNLILAAKKVALMLDNSFDDVSRTGLVLEGFGIDHVHVKLFPLHGTKEYKNNWKEIKSNINIYYKKYMGYISSHDSFRADDKDLSKIAKNIRDKNYK